MKDSIRALRAITPTLLVCIWSLAVSHGAMAQSTPVEIETIRVRATVSDISHKEGFLKLELPNGREAVYKVIETTTTFDRIKVGDKLRVTLLAPLAVLSKQETAYSYQMGQTP